MEEPTTSTSTNTTIINIHNDDNTNSHSPQEDVPTDDPPTSYLTARAKSNTTFVKRLALVASLSGVLFGYDTGVVSGCLIYVKTYMDLSHVQQEIVVSCTVLAAAISAAMGHYCMDMYGRKATLVAASWIFIVGSGVMAVAWGGAQKGYELLVLGRVLVGLAIGLASDAGPLYILECAPRKLRGSLTTLFNVAVVGGQVFASIVCGILSYLPDDWNWRIMLAFGAVPAFCQLVGFDLLPLSPTWLVHQGRMEEAEAVLRRIRGHDGADSPEEEENNTHQEHHEEHQDTTPSDDNQQSLQRATAIARRIHMVANPLRHRLNRDHHDATHDEVIQELQEIQHETEVAKSGHDVSLWQLWMNHKRVRRAMLLGCSLWAVSQLAGINTIMYYGASIVRRTGLDGSKSQDIWITVPLNTMQLIGICICYAIIDKKGRRFTLLTSMLLVEAGLLLIGYGFKVASPLVTLFALCLYLLAFGVGLSTMPYTMNSEIYPGKYSAICVSQATSVFWLTNFVVSFTFLSLADTLGDDGVFFLYSIIVAIAGVAFFIYVPETSGLSLPEIQRCFGKEKVMEEESDNDDEDPITAPYHQVL